MRRLNPPVPLWALAAISTVPASAETAVEPSVAPIQSVAAAAAPVPPANAAPRNDVAQPASPRSAAAAPPKPPTTATGEAAPPLRVPPPPELIPPLVPGLPSGIAAQVPTDRPVTVDEAVRIGLANQPSVAIAAQSVAAARARIRQTRSALGPTVSTGASYSTTTASGGPKRTGISSTGTSSGFNETVIARQLLYDFGHTRANVRAAERQAAAAQEGTARTREDVTYNIRQAYFQTLQDERLSSVAEQTVANQRDHLGEANARFSAGRASQADVLRAQTNLAEGLLTLANARNNAALSRADLNLAMGIDARNPTQLADPGTEPPALPDLNALVAAGETRRPEVRQARETLAAAEANLTAARTFNRPQVTGNVNAGLRGTGFPGDSRSRGLSVSLAWDPFDSGLARGRVAEAQANVESARLTMTQSEQTVERDVTQTYLNVLNAQQRIITTAAEVANAEEALRVAEGRYRAEVGTFLEITDAQSALATARANTVNARFGLDLALAALERAVGGALK